MLPVVFNSRTTIPGGLWTPKLAGDFEEADPTAGRFYVEGRAEIKELAGHLKLFFKDIALIERRMIISDEEKQEIINIEAQKLLDVLIAEVERGGNGKKFDPDDETDLLKAKRFAKAEIEAAAIIRKKKEVFYPNLHVFLSKKRPKKRMTDIYKTGAKVFINADPDGLFGRKDSIGTFEAALKDIPDVLGYQGLVVVKLPNETPKTEEPIIYGMVKFQSARAQRFKTVHSLHIQEVMQDMSKILTTTQGGGGNSGTGGNGASNADAAGNKKKASEHLKPMSYYRTLASKGWLAFNKSQDEEIDFATFLKMLDMLNIFIVDTQARRIFEAVDLDGSGELGPLEMENFLMAYDVLGTDTDLTVLDIYDTFTVEPSDEFKEFFGNKQGMDFSGFVEAAQMLGATKSALEKAQELLDQKKLEQNGGKEADEEGEKEKEKEGSGKEKKKKGKKAKAAQKQVDENDPDKLKEGQNEEEMLLQAYCNASGAKKENISNTFLSLDQFKRAWLKLANLEKELTARKLKFDKIALSEGRNRERLNRYVTDQEKGYSLALSKVVGIIEEIKKEKRLQKEERKKDMAAVREKLLHEAQRFIAVRNQEKRLQVKLEEEEKVAKRNEEKALRMKLQEKQAEAKMTQENAIAAMKNQSEAQRMAEIRARGWNRIDHSMNRLRYIPPAQYDSDDARTLLSYAVIIDYSRNVLDHLPSDNFMYWMQALKKFKLSQNRLKYIPDELKLVTQLECLEMDSNFILSLPTDFGNLTCLRRLDISNNKLTTLPDSFGFCNALEYISAHSNNIDFLPSSIGALFKLEYLDLSGNRLVELPEDFRYLASLIYFNIQNNRIGHLPYYLGECSKLVFFDISNNNLASLPDTFSKLSKLELLFLDRNQMNSNHNNFNMLSSLRKLTMHHNRCKHVYSDIAGCTSVSYMDASNNIIQHLAPEIGLCTKLQTLKLNYNNLVTLPPELGSCTDLQILELQHNDIQGPLPETVGLMELVKTINFGFNSITEIPESIVGLKRITELLAERCKLSFFPSTFTLLTTLTTLEIPNNSFVKFPIELAAMPNLKVLNMCNNQLTLLGRDINLMTQLEVLNIGRNKLRALPTEFTDILETVPNVNLDSNPWSDLPPKWGKMFGDRLSADSLGGYNVEEALEFLYAMKMFYYEAEEIWAKRGSFYYTQRLNFSDFVADLKHSMSKKKFDSLSVDHIKILFFTSRERGIFPKWYTLDDTTLETMRVRVEADEALRHANAERTKADLIQRYKDEHMAYDVDIRRRAMRKEEIKEEYLVNEAIISSTTTTALKNILKSRSKDVTSRRNAAENILYLREVKEMRRLQGIIEDEAKIRAKYNYLYEEEGETDAEAYAHSISNPVSNYNSPRPGSR